MHDIFSQAVAKREQTLSTAEPKEETKYIEEIKVKNLLLSGLMETLKSDGQLPLFRFMAAETVWVHPKRSETALCGGLCSARFLAR